MPVQPMAGSVLTALPWCCIAPAVFSVSGAAIAGVGVGLSTATPLFLLVSLGFLGRALYLSLIRGRGPRWVRMLTLGSAMGVGLLWAFRFGLWPM